MSSDYKECDIRVHVTVMEGSRAFTVHGTLYVGR